MVLGLAALAFLLYRNGNMAAVHAYASGLNPVAAFSLLLGLPLLGVPVSLIHIAAGIRFGVQLGLALVALSILLQLLASYAIVHVWRRHFDHARWLQHVRERIPRGAHTSISIVTVLLPGAPYAAINYVLPLLGVPLRTYLLVAFPLHCLRSTVTVAFGDQSHQLTPMRLAFLLAYALVILGASSLTYRRLRARLESQPAGAGDQKQPA